MNFKTININSWKRKEHYEFFSQFDEPFFGIVSELDCTRAYEAAKKNGFSFFAYYLHKSLIAVNTIDEFRFRIKEKDVVLFEKIHASSTIGRKDETFGYSFIHFDKDFEKFSKLIKSETERIQSFSGLGLNENTKRIDTIHYSSIPWVKFSGLTHPRNFKFADSVPKITFGKTSILNNKMVLPVSINAHHGLMDGLHIAKYLEIFQDLMNE